MVFLRGRGRTGLAGAVAVVALLVAGCSGGASGSTAPETSSAPPPKVTAEPANGAADVNPVSPVRLAVNDGTLEEVRLTNPEGKPVEGQLAADKKSWSTSTPLGYAKTYTWSGKAKGVDGKEAPVEGSFTTVKPKSTVRATLFPYQGEVGVAMPISVKFDQPVRDRAAAEKALKVETSVPVEGSWGWLSGTQVDWRPRNYWPAGTRVKVNVNLYGVPYGDGSWGADNVSGEFTIGRNQVVKINTPTHQMDVYRGGQKVASYPASFGKDAVPDLNTPNGTYIVMEKKDVHSFDNPKYGYTNVLKKWAVRFSNHGEFIHENEDNRANIGRANTSHGCANLTEPDARAYYNSAMIGDPVEVTGASYTLPAQFDVYDWQLDWPTWQSKSALK
ncbi:Lipoprotein-anchoring transpeptidase ErfK/SrfK [Streptoalloteichus hindustanus]|uniref:Lipoprotein-anchoring transpeptidase ErfK/SrfK n=1 Tax=Streptoalloteichus hindustanus TaxID=2017 RepID=A0A1M4TZP5_STRHI|nr:Lipoprotein-anchoring transpeptidase ErfK/SrfK [Streptoalloteichus hindustanus]